METQKTTSRTSLLNMMLLKAWKERWTDSQWGIHIKTILPRGVSGDVYNLADCLLQQAVVGSSASQLILCYLKHSLCAHLISYAAVLKRISKYDRFDKVYCVISLLEFLESIIDGVTCRNKPEESVLPNALVSLVYWLMQILLSVLDAYEVNSQLSSEHKIMLDKTMQVIDKIVKNDFFLGILYIGKHEDLDFYAKLTEKYSEIQNAQTLSGYIPENNKINEQLHDIAYLDVKQLKMTRLDSVKVETISYCVQPLLVIAVLFNPSSDVQFYVNQLLMIQRLKNYSTPRLYYEIIRAGFTSLSNVIETTYDTMWGSFTFIKIPHILKQFCLINSSLASSSPSQMNNENLDYVPDVVEAFKMLLEDTPLLDYMDNKCYCNTIEFLLGNCAKQNLINDNYIKLFSSKRESILSVIQRRDVNNQAVPTINLLLRTEVPLCGILKTLNADYNKVKEALLGMLCQVLVGNSFELILSVAAAEGRLKTFVSRLIICNEKSKQNPDEISKPTIVQSTLFDVSFLMLTFIVQTYGSDAVLTENGDSFFEKWVRECMLERSKTKSAKHIVAQCDENIVEELLLSLSKPDAQLKTSITWQDICMNIPGVLYHVLIAWENDTISSTDVKSILDSIKMRLSSFSVCAASFLCIYMLKCREDELLKPLNMVQQFLSTLNTDEISSQESIKERLALTYQIIRKMQHDVHPTSNAKVRTLTTQNILSNSPLEEQFRDVWKSITDRGWLPIKSAQTLESLLYACGPSWLVTKLVDEIMKRKFTSDMKKTMDIVFSIMHLNIEKTTIALLDELIPSLVFNNQQRLLHEIQLTILAKLCVYCIISNLETSNPSVGKKRSRPEDELDTSSGVKVRKLNSETSSPSSSSGDSSSSPKDFFSENVINKEPPTVLKESLQASVQNLFKIFSYHLATDKLSPKIYFIFHFISLLVECGKDRIKPVLKLVPNNLMQNLLKVMLTGDINVGLICKLYDLRTNQGKQSAVSDLCLMRNIDLKKINNEI